MSFSATSTSAVESGAVARWSRRDLWLIAGVASVAFVIRAIPILGAAFPLNDGGLFAAMIQALQANSWAIPTTVPWNGHAIPFVYPPLGFYLAGMLHVATGASLTDLLRWVPLVFTTVSVPLAYLVAREMLKTRVAAAAAALVFAGAPAAFAWPLDGGGITRAPGICLALLAIWAGARATAQPTWRRGLALGALGGLTALVHPGAATFAAGSVLLLAISRWRSLAADAAGSLAALGVAAVVTLLIVAPWIAVVASHGQLSSLLGASSNGPDPRKTLILLVAGWSTLAGQLDPLAVLMLVQALRLVVKRRFLLPVWWVAASLLSGQYGILVGALLIGTVAGELAELASRRPATDSLRRAGRAGVSLVVVLLAVELVLGVMAPGRVDGHLQALGTERRQAMAWVAAHLSVDARVIVLTGGEWATDADSEWFYELTKRVSVATVQGAEWLGPGAYHEAQVVYQTLQQCATKGAACVAAFLTLWPADYVFIPKGQLQGPDSPDDCCAAARIGLQSRPGFHLVYDGPGASIYQVERVLVGSAAAGAGENT